MKIYPDVENEISPRTGLNLSIPVAFVESKDLTAWQFLENILTYLRHEATGYRELNSILSQIKQLYGGCLNPDADFASTAFYKKLLKVGRALKRYNREKTVRGKRKIEKDAWAVLYDELKSFLAEDSNRKYFKEDLTLQ